MRKFFIIILVLATSIVTSRVQAAFSTIELDLRSGQLGGNGSTGGSKYYVIGDETPFQDDEPANYNAYFSFANFNGSQHGYTNLIASVPVEAGNYKITLGACRYGSGTGSVTNAAGDVEYKSFNQNIDGSKCYDQNTTENVVSVVVNNLAAQTIKVTCGNYTPYIKIEKLAEVEYTVTFAAAGAEGTVPTAVNVVAGESMTIPANKTLYKEGNTLTGWNDGVSTLAIGDSYTPGADVTLNAEFEANDASTYLGYEASTATWNFNNNTGAPTWNMNGSGTFVYVTQTTIGGNSMDVKMDMDATGGKIASNNNWTQINANSTLTVPVLVGAVIKVYVYSSAAALKFDGNDGDFDSSNKIYSYTATADGDLDIVYGRNDYASKVTVDYPPSSVSKTITAAGWATYCSPYALDLEHATGLTDAYIVTGGADGVLAKTSVKSGTVPANTGLLLKASAGTATIPVAASGSTDVSSNKLVGVTAATVIDAAAGYVLMASPTLGFYLNSSAFTVGANTAYLPVGFTGSNPDTAPSAFRIVDEENGATNIDAIDATEEAVKFIENGKLFIKKNNVVYDALGRVVR